MKEPLKKKLVAWLKDELENCEEYLAEKAYAKSADYVTVLEASLPDLGLMINETGLKGDMMKARMRGEDIRTPGWHIQALSDEAFNFEEYKALGKNDGTLRTIGHILDMIGQKKLSLRAYAAMYNGD